MKSQNLPTTRHVLPGRAPPSTSPHRAGKGPRCPGALAAGGTSPGLALCRGQPGARGQNCFQCLCTSQGHVSQPPAGPMGLCSRGPVVPRDGGPKSRRSRRRVLPRAGAPEGQCSPGTGVPRAGAPEGKCSSGPVIPESTLSRGLSALPAHAPALLPRRVRVTESEQQVETS